MPKNKFILVFLFICSTSFFAQNNINNYKYIIVPSQYSFQKSEDIYQINSLIKFLFEKEGYVTLLSSDDFPLDLSQNKCLAITAQLNDISKMLSTKINFDLVDCNDKIIFSTNGISREKSFDKAYNDAIRKAFKNIVDLNYSFTPTNIATTEPVGKTVSVIVEKEKATADSSKNSKKTSSEKISKSKKVTIKKITPQKNVIKLKTDSNLLYAQAIENGYQLIDSTPKVVYILQKTSTKDVFILKNENGFLRQINGNWVAEYYNNGELVSEILNIKF